jgi:hypothetical protein
MFNRLLIAAAVAALLSAAAVVAQDSSYGFVTLSHCCRTLAAVDERNETSVVRRLSFPA